MYSQELFAVRLNNLRLKKGMNLSELSKVLEITPSALGNLEHGRKNPSIELINRMADFFGVSVDYLCGRISVTQGDVEFAARLRLLRERQGKTQEQMAQVLGINVRNYRRYEAGGEPTIPHLVRLADCLCTTTDFLLGRANEG